MIDADDVQAPMRHVPPPPPPPGIEPTFMEVGELGEARELLPGHGSEKDGVVPRRNFDVLALGDGLEIGELGLE